MIVKDTAQMMIAGPALVDFAMPGPHHDKNELGGSHVHVTNGAIDDEAESEDEAFALARRFLSYLPTSVDELPPRAVSDDDPAAQGGGAAVDRAAQPTARLQDASRSSRRSSIARADGTSSFFEIGRQWGKSIICGLARFDGWPVALFAEDPYIYGGAWTASSSQKVTRLIDLASTFHLPLVHLVDCPGFLIGLQAEQEGTIRYGSRALAALGESPSPYCSVVIRKAFGVAGAANWRPGSFHYRCAWPSGDWGSLPIEGGIEVAYKAELAEAEDRDAHLAAIRARLDRVRSPFRSAEAFDIEDIIDPARHASPRVPVGRPRRARATTRTGPGSLPPVSRRARVSGRGRARRGRLRRAPRRRSVARTRDSHSSSEYSKSPGTRCESTT